jgi:sugar lactone lactonase YvrE
MRSKVLRLFSGLAVVLVLFLVGSPPLTHAAAGLYSAQDELGQLDRNGQPTLNQGVVNGKGMSNSAATALDTTHHRLFIAEYARVLVYNLSSSNQLQSIYADNVIGQPDFTVAFTGTSQNSFGSPQGIAYDSVHNRLLLVDPFNNRMLIFNLSGGITNGMNASYVLGQPDFTSSASGTSQHQLSSPSQAYFDAATSNLFVGDTGNHRVLVFNMSGSISNNMNATNVLGQPDFTSGASPGFTQSSTPSAAAITVDDARHIVFVGDAARVLAFDISSGITNGMNASYVIGQPDFTSSLLDNAHIEYVAGLSYDPLTHRLYVSDSNHTRVLVFDVTTLSDGPTPIAVLGQPDLNTVNYNTAQNGLSGPRGLSVDATNHLLYVADSNNRRILIFNTTSLSNGMNASGDIGQTYENGQPNYIGERSYNQNPSSTGAYYPQGTTLDTTHHRLFIADCFWNRIVVYNLDANNNLVSRAASYVIGQADFNSNVISTPPTSSSLYCPVSTVYDAVHDRLFTTDSAGRVLVYNLSGGITNGMNASYVLGKSNFTTATGAFTPNQSNLFRPTGLQYDPTTGNLFVADDTINRIMVFNLSGGITNGMNASYVIGQPDFASQNCAITQSGITQPFGMLLDTDHHRLFMADAASCSGSYAARVLVYDTNAISTGMNASAVIGEPDFTSTHDPNTATRNTVGFPSGLAYDAQNQQLFVSDDYGNRVMVFDVATITNGEDAMGVLGQQDFTSNNYDCLPNASDICDPEGFVDQFDTANRRLYFSDSFNARVLIFGFAKLANTIPDGTANANYGVALGSQTQGTTTYTVESGSMPAGVSLNSSTGVLSGTPTAAGDYTFRIAVSDNNGNAGTYTDSKAYTFHIASSASNSGTTSGGSGTSSSGSTSTAPAADTTTNPTQKTSANGIGNPTSNTSDSTPSTTAPIMLDNLNFTTSGATVEVHEGDQLQYSLTENGKPTTYNIVVKKIATDTVDLAFESHDGDVSLHIGGRQNVMVGQGQFTVNTRLNSIVGGSANITFKLASIATNMPYRANPSTATQPAHHTKWWYWVGGAALGLMVIIAVVQRITVARRVR